MHPACTFKKLITATGGGGHLGDERKGWAERREHGNMEMVMREIEVTMGKYRRIVNCIEECCVNELGK